MSTPSTPRTLLAWWRRHAGVRVRTALTAAVVVGAALAGGSVLFVVLLQRNLATTVDGALLQQALIFADTIHQRGASGLDLRRRVGENNVVQVLDAAGSILAASPGLEGEAALSSVLPQPNSYVQFTRQQLSVVGEEPFRVVALGVTSPDGRSMVVIVAQSLESVQASKKTVTGLLLFGAPFLLLLVAGLTYWLSGRALRPVEVMRQQVADIDERTLAAQLPLPEAQDEVWRLGRTMNHMLDRLDSAATAQRRFVSDASHELRSPLTALRASVEVAQAHPDTADWTRTADIVLEESLRLERLVADLLLLARADERGLQLRREDVDLDDLLAAEVERLRATTSLTVTSHIVHVRVVGDRDRLQRALRNLVDNASQHASSAVTLSVASDAAMAKIDIVDDGPGVPVADRLRVFDRFVRLDDSRTRTVGGTGLGLAIVRQIARAHHGDVAFLDAPNGSTVRLCLPMEPGKRSV